MDEEIKTLRRSRVLVPAGVNSCHVYNAPPEGDVIKSRPSRTPKNDIKANYKNKAEIKTINVFT